MSELPFYVIDGTNRWEWWVLDRNDVFYPGSEVFELSRTKEEYVNASLAGEPDLAPMDRRSLKVG